MGALPAGLREEMPSAVSKGLAVLGRDVVTYVHRAGKTEVAAHEMHCQAQEGELLAAKISFS